MKTKRKEDARFVFPPLPGGKLVRIGCPRVTVPAAQPRVQVAGGGGQTLRQSNPIISLFSSVALGVLSGSSSKTGGLADGRKEEAVLLCFGLPARKLMSQQPNSREELQAAGLRSIVREVAYFTRKTQDAKGGSQSEPGYVQLTIRPSREGKKEGGTRRGFFIEQDGRNERSSFHRGNMETGGKEEPC